MINMKTLTILSKVVLWSEVVYYIGIGVVIGCIGVAALMWINRKGR